VSPNRVFWLISEIIRASVCLTGVPSGTASVYQKFSPRIEADMAYAERRESSIGARYRDPRHQQDRRSQEARWFLFGQLSGLPPDQSSAVISSPYRRDLSRAGRRITFPRPGMRAGLAGWLERAGAGE
jgi:hypothetical protein